MKPRLSQRFQRHTGGAAAVEFALVAPMLGGVLAALIPTWTALIETSQMRSAVHAGADYLRAGGSDAALVRSVVERSWEDMPEQAGVSVAESCACDAAVSRCSALCPSGSPPALYVEISASFGDPDRRIGRTAAEVVRVR